MKLVLDHLSLGLILDDVIADEESEKQIMENVKYCRKSFGKLFKLIFINKNVPEPQVKEFFKRHEKTLFEVNTTFTKYIQAVWFIISGDNDKTKYRYKYKGSILNGIAEYRKMVNILIKKDRDENRNSWK